MKKIIFFIALFFGSLAFSQTKDTLNEQNIYEEIIEEPLLLNNNSKFFDAFKSNFDLKKIKGNSDLYCELKAIFDRNGILKTVLINCENPSIKNEIEKSISKIKGNWKPGKVNGVNCDLYISMSFRIVNNNLNLVRCNSYTIY